MENSIIEIKNIGTFKYNYKIDPNIKYNIISIVLFKMKHSYKNFKSYIDGLFEIKKYYKKYLPDFVIRLYYDKSVINDKDFIKLYKLYNESGEQLVEYECSYYKNGVFHKGTFLTLIRYIPFFNFKYNDTNIVYIYDADAAKKIISFKYNAYNLKKFIDSNAEFFRTYWICHNPFHIPIQKNFILGFGNSSKIKFPLKLFKDFIKNAYKIKDLYSKLYEKVMKNKKHNDPIFFYGIDEFFLSTIIKTYLDKHKIKYMTYIKPDYQSLYDSLNNRIFYKSITNKNKYIYNEIINLINKKFNKNFKNINELFYYIGKEIDYERKTDKHKIYEYFRKIIISLYPKYKKELNINQYDCLVKIDKYYDNTNQLVITN
jgi:hypothetical protein